MLVVHGDFGDTDTRVLSTMWEGLDNVKVFRLSRDNPSGNKDALVNCLEQEEDTVLFCGHGSSGGCGILLQLDLIMLGVCMLSQRMIYNMSKQRT